jgi:hypothetical protein
LKCSIFTLPSIRRDCSAPKTSSSRSTHWRRSSLPQSPLRHQSARVNNVAQQRFHQRNTCGPEFLLRPISETKPHRLPSLGKKLRPASGTSAAGAGLHSPCATGQLPSCCPANRSASRHCRFQRGRLDNPIPKSSATCPIVRPLVSVSCTAYASNGMASVASFDVGVGSCDRVLMPASHGMAMKRRRRSMPADVRMLWRCGSGPRSAAIRR